MVLDADRAQRIADRILPSIHREYPNKIAHVLESDAAARPPRELTPIFFGCFDWHSAVHSHFALARLLRLFPGARFAAAARRALSESFRAERVAGELAYLGAPARRGFEMPYGMAWLLELGAELRRGPAGWHGALAPLEALAAERFAWWLPRLSHPIRGGEHTQTAFAIGLALDWARAAGDRPLEELLTARALDFYAGDRDGPLAYEPSAHDFLSPCLAEADLLSRILPAGRFAAWLTGFLPRIDLEPVATVDRADGKLVHFDGLNLSRAWMLRRVGAALPAADPRRPDLAARAGRHLAAGLDGLASDHYAGAHWLGTFALYALTAPAMD